LQWYLTHLGRSLGGKITEAFWEAKSSKWNQEEQQILLAAQGLEQRSPEWILDGVRILELANEAYFFILSSHQLKKQRCSESYFRPEN
jgi:hypothetical protein